MAISETIKLALAVLVGCAILYGAQTVFSWKEAAEQNERRGRTLEATSGIIKDESKNEEQRLVIDTGLLEGRARFNQQLEDDNNEPKIAARGSSAVPDSRLRAFRERRLARERLGCTGAECQPGSEDPPPAER
jgi:hypothetical protein